MRTQWADTRQGFEQCQEHYKHNVAIFKKFSADKHILIYDVFTVLMQLENAPMVQCMTGINYSYQNSRIFLFELIMNEWSAI